MNFDIDIVAFRFGHETLFVDFDDFPISSFTTNALNDTDIPARVVFAKA